ncbi:MAG: hypothetical protein J6D03_09440 [Clostridia bacterium]|nr:hypothetical protein [Clostridia bacterium]
MRIFVGIDPSVNSTGVCMQFYNDNLTEKKISDKFYIIRGNKLTKKETKAEQENIEFFKYVLYDKIETSKSENNHEFERIKTDNFIKIVDSIYSIVQENYKTYNIEDDPILSLWVCQEGISYGSTMRTKSIFDLAGLNFMLRMKFIKSDSNIEYIIGTPGEIKKFATGAGNANKELIVSVFKSTYPEINLPKIDDIADAYFMASYARYLYEKAN